jgi:hypothetical protein
MSANGLLLAALVIVPTVGLSSDRVGSAVD